MSKKKNELPEDDAAMDASEFEIIESIEVTIEKVDPYGTMESAEFEAKLIEFFTKFKKSKLRLVPRIVETFKGYEGIVLEHLQNKYVLGLTSQKSIKKTIANTGEHGDQPKNIKSSKEVKPKSKKTLVIVIIIVVILAGLGVAGFLMKDKIMGMLGKGHATEQVAPKAKTETEVKSAKKELTPQQVETILDTTKSAPVDSTIKK